MMRRWDPLRELTGLQEDMNRLFETVTRRSTGPTEAGGSWRPPVDIYEDDGSYVLVVELPGLEKEAVEIHLESRTLTVRGDRVMAQGISPESYHRLERQYGRFSRSFALPSTVEQSRISACFKNGVLRVILPKAAEIKPKVINVVVE